MTKGRVLLLEDRLQRVYEILTDPDFRPDVAISYALEVLEEEEEFPA